jgi:hypothetical protein
MCLLSFFGFNAVLCGGLLLVAVHALFARSRREAQLHPGTHTSHLSKGRQWDTTTAVPQHEGEHTAERFRTHHAHHRGKKSKGRKEGHRATLARKLCFECAGAARVAFPQAIAHHTRTRTAHERGRDAESRRCGDSRCKALASTSTAPRGATNRERARRAETQQRARAQNGRPVRHLSTGAGNASWFVTWIRRFVFRTVANVEVVPRRPIVSVWFSGCFVPGSLCFRRGLCLLGALRFCGHAQAAFRAKAAHRHTTTESEERECLLHFSERVPLCVSFRRFAPPVFTQTRGVCVNTLLGRFVCWCSFCGALCGTRLAQSIRSASNSLHGGRNRAIA